MFKIAPEAFGLDIADNSLKIVQLQKRRRYLKLSSFINQSLPSGLIKQGEILKPQELLIFLKKAILQVKGKALKTKYVLASLPEEKSFVRVIPLPLMDKQEIKRVVKWEVEAHIPLKSEEVYLDWQLVQPLNKKSKQMYVLIAAAPQKLINSYNSLLEEADLVPLGLEVESVAIARALIKNTETQEPVPILDIGSLRTSFLLYSGTTLCFTSTIPLGGSHLSQAISKKMSVDSAEAERLKLKIGLDKKRGKQIIVACEPILNELVTNIKKYLDFFQHQCPLGYAPCEPIKKILLCGGGAQLFGLTTFLSLGLKLPVELGNPWVNILKPPLKSVPHLSFTESLGFSTGLGLALAACNLSL